MDDKKEDDDEINDEVIDKLLKAWNIIIPKCPTCNIKTITHSLSFLLDNSNSKIMEDGLTKKEIELFQELCFKMEKQNKKILYICPKCHWYKFK